MNLLWLGRYWYFPDPWAIMLYRELEQSKEKSGGRAETSLRMLHFVILMNGRKLNTILLQSGSRKI